MEGGVEVAHGLNEGVNGATVFQVTDHRYVEVLKGALCLTDTVQVEHALGWVLVGTVAGVDDGHRSHL